MHTLSGPSFFYMKTLYTPHGKLLDLMNFLWCFGYPSRTHDLLKPINLSETWRKLPGNTLGTTSVKFYSQGYSSKPLLYLLFLCDKRYKPKTPQTRHVTLMALNIEPGSRATPCTLILNEHFSPT